MTELSFETMRRAMVASQLRTNAVSDTRVIAALTDVPRERFVPAERIAAAYTDVAIPLAGGRWLNSPLVTARLLTELHPQAGERVLVVGAATGYSAAVLARLGCSVTALEEAGGPENVAVDGVRFVRGPLAEGWAEGAPYDLIFIDGAVESVPQALVDQLVDGGRLGTAIIEGGVSRLAVGRRAGSGFGLNPFVDFDAVHLPGFAPPPAFKF